MMDRPEFIKLLNEYITGRGIADEELGLLIGTTRQTVWRWRTGQTMPSFETALDICKILKLTEEGQDKLLKAGYGRTLPRTQVGTSNIDKLPAQELKPLTNPQSDIQSVPESTNLEMRLKEVQAGLQAISHGQDHIVKVVGETHEHVETLRSNLTESEDIAVDSDILPQAIERIDHKRSEVESKAVAWEVNQELPRVRCHDPAQTKLAQSYAYNLLLKGWFHDGTLKDADLRRGNLMELDLSNANLENADLRGADLRKTNLRGSNLSNAKFKFVPERLREFLSTSSWRATDLRGAVYDSLTKWPKDFEPQKAGAINALELGDVKESYASRNIPRSWWS